ncbi:MAG: type II secretion system F family protein [Methylococcaceae bacterium]
MQLLSGLLQNQQGNEWIVILMVAGAIFILAFALMSLFADSFDPVRSRLKYEINADANSLVDSNITEKLRRHNKVFIPSNEPLLERTKMRLHYGGFHGKNSLLYYYAIRMLLMILLPLLVLVVTVLIPGMKTQTMVLSLLVAVALGYLGPSFTLDKFIANRQKIIRRAFPDALDLLVICSEAGLSLDAAIQKVAAEISISQPELADELDIVIAETRAGIDRHKALQRLVERTGVEDIKGLVTALSQSMRFGTSIVETLNIYSEDLRDKRTQVAEEVAAKIGTKLIFPLTVCLLPAFLIVIMAPAFIIFKNL